MHPTKLLVWEIIFSVLMAFIFLITYPVISTFAVDKKIIVWGGIPGSGGQPSPPELEGNLSWVTQLPADGFVYNVSNIGGYLPEAIFDTSKKITYEQIEPDVKLMKSFLPKLGKIRENFIRLNIGSISADWFDDTAWEVIISNVGVMAKGGHESGAVGIMFDTEQYGYDATPICAPFGYAKQKRVKEMTFEEYYQQTRKRGAQFSGAVLTNFPEAKFLFTYATSSAYNPVNPKHPLSGSVFGLLPSFIDGMMDGAPTAEFIDGYEGSYYFKIHEQFVSAREIIKEKASTLSLDPDRYNKRMKVGFGIFLYGSNGQDESASPEFWPFSTDFTKNSLTPDQYKKVLKYAMELSDDYIWLYAFPWISPPEKYLNVIKGVREEIDGVQKKKYEEYIFYAKKMKIFNATPNVKDDQYKQYTNAGVKKNWYMEGEYVKISTTDEPDGVINSTGTVGFSPDSDEIIQDGVYKVVIDICHDNVKKHNAGDPVEDRNGSFAYLLTLSGNSSGKLDFLEGSKSGWNTYYPQDPDNAGGNPYHGTVALTNFVAYGPGAMLENAKGAVKITGVKSSELVFQLWDQVFLNYGAVGLKSIRLVPISN